MFLVQIWSLVKRDFDAAVHVAAFFCMVVILEGLAATDGGHPAARDALLLEVILHGICAVLRKNLVVGIGANVVSPALQDNALVRVGLDQPPC